MFYKNTCKRCGTMFWREKNVFRVCGICKLHDKYKLGQGWIKAKKECLLRDKKCQMCGVEKRLHVHHKDRNRKNNLLDNLIVYCASCHLSQHGSGFKKPIDIKIGEFGTRLTYN